MKYSVNWAAPVYEFSGYGEFARYFISSLYDEGVDINVEPMTPKLQNLDLGHGGKIAQGLINSTKVNKQDINVINFIAPLFQRFMKPGKINIGFTMWEADRLPDSWVSACNAMDGILVPSRWNYHIFNKSGVTVPIFVVQPGVQGERSKQQQPEKKFEFYSIFQWIERKNPQTLLKAYYSAFSGHTDVVLVMKTYRQSGSNNDAFVRDAISKINGEIKATKPLPEVRINTSVLTDAQVAQIHQSGDCFVLPTRAEGFGLPQMEAMSYGNPVISTDYSGLRDFMFPDNSFLLDYHLTQVSNMNWYVPWFDVSMYWAEPSAYQLARHMRFVYESREAARAIGQVGKQTIVNSFTPKHSVKQLNEAIAAIVDNANKKKH